MFCGEPATTPRVLPQACSVGSQVSHHGALTGLCRDYAEKSPVSNASTTLSYGGSLLRNGAAASVIPRYRKQETPRQGDETTLSGKCLLNKCKDLSSIPGTHTKTLGRWQACVIPVLGRGKLEDPWDSLANQGNLISESQDLVRESVLKKQCEPPQNHSVEDNIPEPMNQEQTSYEL